MKHTITSKSTQLVTIAALSAQICTFAAPRAGADKDYVAHEWGTFTSVQGADGIPQPWHPLITSELPAFVYNHTGSLGSVPSDRPNSYLGKESYIALQRLETPVIYFYSDGEQMVNATVQFPHGQITEWYPSAAARPVVDGTNPAPMRNGQFQWRNVRVLANSPAKNDITLPTDEKGSHYYAARATDANLLEIAPAQGGSPAEHEKFLFYRGVGWFATPLRATLAGDEAWLELSNQGAEPLAHLFVVEISKGKARYKHLPTLASKATERVAMDAVLGDQEQVTAKLADALREALQSDGLYPREAAAMVATWNQSWFSEDGLRVLYLLPRAWTDQVLPLELSPAPKSLVRTMVGRAEMLRPSVERQLVRQIQRFGDPTPGTRLQAISDTRALGLGRFLEPAVRRAQQQSQSRDFQDWANQLLDAAGKPAKESAAIEKPGATLASRR
jgi:hypothetical protein